MINFLGLRKLTSYLFLVVAAISWSQQIVRLGSNSSTVRGEISAFAKDSLGFMWVGTDQGIKKYSGFSFKSYQLADRSGGNVKDITGIINYKERLYALSKEGYLYNYNFEFDAFEEIYSNPEQDFLSSFLKSFSILSYLGFPMRLFISPGSLSKLYNSSMSFFKKASTSLNCLVLMDSISGPAYGYASST